jgi:glycosyltransferase involved in cell wall biosynthesis
MTTKIRLHIAGIPHTITNNEYSHCAFTGKVLRFPPMMMSVGYEVYYYGVETSEVIATKNITLLTKDEWYDLCIKSYKQINNISTYEEAEKKFNNKQRNVGDLSISGTPIYNKFNERFHSAIVANYRSPQTDIICLPLQKAHDPALEGLDVLCVETGIGYPDSYRGFRIFESYAHLHFTLGAQKILNCPNYFFVAPNYYNTIEFPLNLSPVPKRIGFFARICDLKGMSIVIEVAKKFPDIEFVICGNGNPSNYLVEKNIVYKEPIHGNDRGIFLGELTALLHRNNREF